MKGFFILSTELLSFIAVGFLVGWFLDDKFLLGGWASILCLFVAYILWFVKFYKKLHKRK